MYGVPNMIVAVIAEWSWKYVMFYTYLLHIFILPRTRTQHTWEAWVFD